MTGVKITCDVGMHMAFENLGTSLNFMHIIGFSYIKHAGGRIV